MAVDERARRHLQEQLSTTLGQEAADTLMEEIGSLGREQLGTRHDIQLLSQRMNAGFARMDDKFELLRSEVHAEIADFRAEMADFRAEMKGDLALQTRQLGLWFIGALAGMAGVILAAAQL